MSLEGLVGNTNYDSSDFTSTTAYIFSQHIQNQANGLYDDNLNDPILIPNDLSIIADPTIPIDTGETSTQVQDIGILNGDNSINFVDSVDVTNVADMYQFTIDQSNDVSITLDGLSADADLGIFSSSGEILEVSENADMAAEILEVNLSAGTYFVGVASYQGAETNYDLTISSGNSALSSVETNLGVDPVSMSPEFSVM